MTFKVTRWLNGQGAKNIVAEAGNHKEALCKSGLLQNGEEFTVDGDHATIRFRTDAAGRITELSRYSY